MYKTLWTTLAVDALSDGRPDQGPGRQVHSGSALDLMLGRIFDKLDPDCRGYAGRPRGVLQFCILHSRMLEPASFLRGIHAFYRLCEPNF